MSKSDDGVSGMEPTSLDVDDFSHYECGGEKGKWTKEWMRSVRKVEKEVYNKFNLSTYNFFFI